MMSNGDAVRILKAAGFTELQATQFCGSALRVSLDAICGALSVRNTSKEPKDG